MVQSIVVVNNISKWYHLWLTGIKELSLENSSTHLCYDFVFTCEDLTYAVFHDVLQLTWISKSVVRYK